VIRTDVLNTDKQLLRRAHKVLTFLVHFYAHSIPPSELSGPITIPRSLVSPLLQVSKELGMAPVVTMSDVVSWNWEYINPELPFSAENVRFGTDLFGGSEDERNFFAGNGLVEIRGVEMLQIFNDYQLLVSPPSSRRSARSLRQCGTPSTRRCSTGRFAPG